MSLRGRAGQAFPGRRLSAAVAVALGCGRFRTGWDSAGAHPRATLLLARGVGQDGDTGYTEYPERSDACGWKHAWDP